MNQRLVLLLLSLIVILTSCTNFSPNRLGTLQSDPLQVDLAGATKATIEIYNGVGDVRLEASNTAVDSLLTGILTYNVADWKPQVSHTHTDPQEALLTIRQPELLTGLGFEDMGTLRYDFDLALNPNIPTNLSIEMGVGTADINLAQQHLSQLTLRMGAGTGQVDLSQIRPANLDVLVMGGIGRTTLLLPKDMGVRVTVEGGAGLSEINTTGLIQRDAVTFINEAYNTAVPVLNIIIHPAVGTIDLQVVE